MACLVLMSLFFFLAFFFRFSLPFLIKMYVKIRLGCQCPQAQNSSRAGEGWRGSSAEVLASNLDSSPVAPGADGHGGPGHRTRIPASRGRRSGGGQALSFKAFSQESALPLMSWDQSLATPWGGVCPAGK